MSDIELSIVVTAHQEGFLLHKALNSVFRATEELEKNKISYEVIVHIDKGDEKTVNVVKNHPFTKRIRLLRNSFGSLSQSRNYAASVANGKYVTFLDGDDYVSKNWFLVAIGILKKRKDDCVVYPEAIVDFRNDSNKHVLVFQKEYTGEDEDFLTLLSGNCWASVVMAKKKVFLDTPYLLMDKGYCYEDYAFNVQTLEKKIPHLIAPGTLFFYRKQGTSMLAQANSDWLALPRMSFFDLKKVKKKYSGVDLYKSERIEELAVSDDSEDKLNGESENGSIEHEKTFRDNYLYRKIRNNWFLNYFITPFLRLALMIKSKFTKDNAPQEEDEDEAEDEVLTQELREKEEFEERIRSLVPDYVLEQWREINKIDIQLYPTVDDLKNTSVFDVRLSIDIGKSYVSLAKSFKHFPDYVFIVPWIVKGGADKVMFNYLKAIHEIHPHWHLAVITTLNKKRSWLEELPNYVDLYELGLYTPYLSSDGAEMLLTLLLTQLGCKKIHIINSELGYRWARKHERLVKADYAIDVSIFNSVEVEEWDGGEKESSYESPGLFEIFSNVNLVFSDNTRYLNVMKERNGFDRKKLKVHYQPINTSPKEPRIHKKMKRKILWAGRITPVKLPSLAIEIGEIMKNEVQIDMFGTIDTDSYPLGAQIFEGVEGVKYCGEFDSFDKLPIENYDLLLYTAQNDGIPNIILEATAAGLPIIASNDGGVGEFIIHEKTGILIEDYYKPEEYVRAIKDVYDGKYDLDKMVLNAQKLLKERHSWKKFVDVVRKDIN